VAKDKQPDGQKITVRISDNLNQWYTVKKKPNKSPFNEYNGKPIQWVTCFGFALNPGIERGQRKLDSDGFIISELEEAYTISLTKDGNQLVYYDGKKIETLDYSPVNAKRGDTVQATLKAGDPAIGWG
jgi:hypothetical protein